MQVIDTTGAKNYDQASNDSAFLPGANYAFVTATKILTITDTSTIDAGDTFAAALVEVYDQKGVVKTGRIAALGGNVAIDLDAAPSLDMTGKIAIKVRVVTAKEFSKTGIVYDMPVTADIAATAVPFADN